MAEEVRLEIVLSDLLGQAGEPGSAPAAQSGDAYRPSLAPEVIPPDQFGSTPTQTAKNVLRPIQFLGNRTKERQYLNELLAHPQLQAPAVQLELRRLGEERLAMYEKLRRDTGQAEPEEAPAGASAPPGAAPGGAEEPLSPAAASPQRVQAPAPPLSAPDSARLGRGVIDMLKGGPAGAAPEFQPQWLGLTPQAALRAAQDHALRQGQDPTAAQAFGKEVFERVSQEGYNLKGVYDQMLQRQALLGIPMEEAMSRARREAPRQAQLAREKALGAQQPSSPAPPPPPPPAPPRAPDPSPWRPPVPPDEELAEIRRRGQENYEQLTGRAGKPEPVLAELAPQPAPPGPPADRDVLAELLEPGRERGRDVLEELLGEGAARPPAAPDPRTALGKDLLRGLGGPDSKQFAKDLAEAFSQTAFWARVERARMAVKGSGRKGKGGKRLRLPRGPSARMGQFTQEGSAPSTGSTTRDTIRFVINAAKWNYKKARTGFRRAAHGATRFFQLARSSVGVSPGENLAFLGEAARKAALGLETVWPASSKVTRELGKWLGPAGALAGSVINAAGAFEGRAREIGAYSADITAATAVADVQRLLMDINEAQVLGPKMAKMIEKEVELEKAFRDIMLPIKEGFLDILIPALKFIKEAIEWLWQFGRDTIAGVLSTLADILHVLPGKTAEIEKNLKAEAEEFRKKWTKDAARDMVDEMRKAIEDLGGVGFVQLEALKNTVLPGHRPMPLPPQPPAAPGGRGFDF